MSLNLVILCGGYYPNFSATGNCIRQIANAFVEKGCSVTVLQKSSDGLETEELFEGQQLYRVTDARVRAFAKIQGFKRGSLISKVRTIIIKSYWATRLLLTKSGMDEALVKSYVKKLKELSKNQIDAVIACCMPIEAVKAGFLFCKENDKPFFPVLYDRYSENEDFFRFAWVHRIKKKRAEKLERQIFQFAERVYYVDNWKYYFEKRDYDNIERVEHPLVVQRVRDPRMLEHRTAINVIYQGELNHQMRPADAMLSLFESISQYSKNISLHVFASGNAVPDVIRVSEHDNNIWFYGRVPKKTADQYYDDADITVIMANRDKEIVSSKIFESVASGIPIIYFYFSEQEASYRLLSKYPLVKFVKQDSKIKSKCEEVVEWMSRSKGKSVDFSLVRELYSDATPDYLVDSIISRLEK